MIFESDLINIFEKKFDVRRQNKIYNKFQLLFIETDKSIDTFKGSNVFT